VSTAAAFDVDGGVVLNSKKMHLVKFHFYMLHINF